jgi:hypothetical protein
MAYCSYCAAVLDPAQPACSRCGNATGAVVTAPQIVTPIVASEQRPSSIRIAVVLLLISAAIGILSIANVFLRYHAVVSPFLLMRTIGLTTLMILLMIALWQRQSWARIVIALLIAWGVGGLILSIIRFPAFGARWTFAISIAIDAVRLFAVYLMFKPESNAWFKK